MKRNHSFERAAGSVRFPTAMPGGLGGLIAMLTYGLVVALCVAACVGSMVDPETGTSRSPVGAEAPPPPDTYFERFYQPDHPDDVARLRSELLRQRGTLSKLGARTDSELSKTVGGWQSIGPFGKQGLCDASVVFSGRMISFERDFHDPEILYAGAASGGLWRSVDGGTSWENVFDDLASPSVSAIASDPLQAGHVWIGTGDRGNGRKSSAVPSLGLLYRSTDSGTTWQLVPFTSEEVRWISRIVHLPQIANPDLVFVATNVGVFRFDSTNGWQKVLAIAASDLVAHAPLLDSSVQLVAAEDRGDELWISTDGGASWVSRSLPGGSPPYGRISLADSRISGHDTVYASVATMSGGWAGVWRSDDFGLGWQKVTTPVTNAVQMNYNNAIGVHSTQPFRVFAGANQGDLYLSTTSGVGAWTPGSTYPNGVTHQDHHFILADACTVFEVNDGGVWKSTDCGQNFVELGNRYLAVAQIYHLTINEAAPAGLFTGDRYYIGTQDVGISYGPDEFLRWSNVTCCDGGDITFRNGVPFSTLTGLSSTSIRRYQYPTAGNWCQQTTAFAQGLPAGPPWANRLIYDGSNFWTEFFDNSLGLGGIYRRGFSSTSPWVLWRTFASDVTTFGVSPEGFLAVGVAMTGGVAPGDQIWLSDSSGFNWRRADVDPSWGSKIVTDFAFGSATAEGRRVYATLSGVSGTRIILSEDSGLSYRDVTGDLPTAVNASALVVDPANDHMIYLGTDLGVYVSTDRGAHWEPFSDGLPTVGFSTDLEFDGALGKVVLATYGRGVFVRGALPPTPAPESIIFVDGFESGDTSAW